MQLSPVHLQQHKVNFAPEHRVRMFIFWRPGSHPSQPSLLDLACISVVFCTRRAAQPLSHGRRAQHVMIGASCLGSSVSVGIAQCKQLKMSNTCCLTALFTASTLLSGGNTSLCLVQINNSGTLGSSLSRMLTTLVMWHTTFTCALSDEINTPDCKA